MFTELDKRKAIAVLIIDNSEDAVLLAKTLIDNGISAMELTLRTPAALESITAIKNAVPEMLTGAGTVLTPQQVEDVTKAGADFAVSPGVNPRVLDKANELSLPFAPGIITPSDIEQALEFGCKVLKFFPAEVSGGLDYLKAMSAPYQHLGLKYIPLGGLNSDNIESYLKSPLISAVGGSWIAGRKLIQNKDWKTIAENARKTADIIKTCAHAT